MTNQEATSQHTHHRPVTLPEVIIVALIVLIVGALGLVALQTLRIKDEGRLMCLNNLKQLGLACHNYEVVRRGRYPTGTIIDSAAEPEQRLSVLVTLLPYLEHEALYKSLDRTQGWEAAANSPVVSLPVKQFSCLVATKGAATNVTSYVGVAGVGIDAAKLPTADLGAGVFGYDLQVNSADFASCPMLFIETTRNNGPWAAGGPATLRGIDPAVAVPISQSGPFGKRYGRKAVANVVFADGSVQTLDGGTSAAVLASLARIR